MRGAVLFVASIIGIALLYQRASVYYYDDPNVGKMIRSKNSAIRGQYTRRENKIRAMWDEFYTRLGNVVSTVYLLPKDVATLVVEKARSDDLDEYDEPGKINEFAEFANEIVNAIE